MIDIIVAFSQQVNSNLVKVLAGIRHHKLARWPGEEALGDDTRQTGLAGSVRIAVFAANG